VFNYLAMGDSITAGSFDEENGVPTNQGGYPGRLDAHLGCDGSPSSCAIYNEGVGGNTTSQMLSRINGVLNQRPYDAMLLMGGTNDIFKNTSNETIEFNLTELSNRASARGVDTVFASIIRFHPSGIHGTSKDPQVADLRARVTGLAGQRSGYLADNWPLLCPNGSCFANHYYDCVGNPGQPPPCGANRTVDPVGHPDGSGYDIMAITFAAGLTFEDPPGVPEPTSPSGTVPASPTTYTWKRDPGTRATWHQLEIDGPGGTVHSRWYEARFHCGGSSCSVNPGVSLAPGSYSFRVRGRTPRGRGDWSEPGLFTVLAPPEPPNPLAPKGTFYSAAPLAFVFEWSTSANATEYDLEVTGSGTQIAETYAAASICGGSSCASPPSPPLSGGAYSWRVRARNGAGTGPWSKRTSFTVVDSPPAPPVPGYPDRSIFNPDPSYMWTGAKHTNYYRLEVFFAAGGKRLERTFSAAKCLGTVCSRSTGEALAPGNYTWRVIGGNPLGESPPSVSQAFTVRPCSPQSRQVQNQVVTSTVLVEACQTVIAGDLGAGPYVVGAGGDVTLYAGGSVEIQDGFSVSPGGMLTLGVDP
jgi:hypothetical protein